MIECPMTLEEFCWVDGKWDGKWGGGKEMSRTFLVCLLGNVCSVLGGYLIGKGFLEGFAVCVLGGYLIGLSWKIAEMEAEKDG